MAILALTTAMASTAAAKPEFLDNVKGNTFEGKGGASQLTILGGSAEVTCKENTISGEITGSEEGTIKDWSFKSCKLLGFSANTLGDASGNILISHIPFKLCYINEAKKEVGLYLENISAHIETSFGFLLNVTGRNILKIIIKFLPYVLKSQQSAAGDQTPITCTLLGKELKASLVASQDAKHEKNESVALVLTDEGTFAKEIQIDA